MHRRVAQVEERRLDTVEVGGASPPSPTKRRRRNLQNDARRVMQLGMTQNRAKQILQKSIIFHLLRQRGQDVCFRCGGRIERLEDLSIDHKVDWFNNNPVLFWQIDNITFSHLRCNSLAGLSRQHEMRRRTGPPGTVWCGGHKAFLPIEAFHRVGTRWNGRQKVCRECVRNYQRKYRAEKKGLGGLSDHSGLGD